MKPLSPTARVLLGLATLWPFLYMFVFFAFIFGSMALDASGNKGALAVSFAVLFALHALTILSIFLLLVFYIVHLFQNDRIPNDLKALWAVILFMGNAVAMPVYFVLYVWKDQRAEGG